MRKTLPIISFGYSLLLLYVCLVNVNEVVEIPSYNDKLTHLIAYFLFTSVWFLFFYGFQKKTKKQALTRSFIFAIVFGIIIEVLQKVLTEHRQADYKDLIANVIGALIAVIIINLITYWKVKNN
ncbi:VanZ family protein [Olleya sp. YSTF-M6]|uniref:VanZ family protein n=1 Tax=Olleya sediminilitoris TaxID=2795739 RepID=A0ABS1WM06_9FLAO|nr:VanZ family protein [Olleya sediminilitoris]MBL7560135.1 VanZ family protein [Olleya sediminilitoris]